MSFIQNLFSSRDNNANTETYVGQTDRIWYNPDNNTFRVSDGSTPGGLPIDYSSNANVDINSLTVNTVTVNTAITSTGGNINFTGNLVISGNITAATDTKIGGVRAGPGANISNTGLLTIDTTGLPLSFGNFTANNNILTIVNADEDMILATQGSAEIQLVGNIGFYKPNGLPPSVDHRYFYATNDGQITILVPTEDPITGGVEIIGSASGNFIAPGTSGTMLHLTGNPNVSCRLYQDSIGSYSSFVGRRYNGNVASPTQVLAGQDVLRFNATAATDAGVGNTALAQIAMTALEDQTTTAQGSEITFTVTPVGSPASARVEVANIGVANGVSATKFTTSGNVVANVIVAASAGNINLAGNLVPTANVYTLGTEADPWQSAYFGPESITIADSTGNVANAVVIENAAGNVTLAAAGFEIQTLDTGAPIFRIAALTGQVYSNALTIIENDTDSANVTSGSLQTAGGAGIAKNLYVGGNITAGNVSATNYTGLVTHSIRNAGAVGGTTLTLNVTTDDIVKCTFADNFTVAFSNIIPGRVVTLIATNTSGGDSDVVSAGISSVNMQGDSTLTVTEQTTAVITYYSLDGDTANIYASAVYA